MTGAVGGALTRAFLAHRDELFAYALVLVQDPHIAEDVFQELGISIVQEESKGTKTEHFLSWARTILRNRVADYFRKEGRHRRRTCHYDDLAEIIEQSFAENEAPEPREHLDMLPNLQHCLDTLSPRARSIVDARYRQNLSLAEIASTFSWKVNAVKVALSKARRHLRECVDRQRRRERIDA